MGEFSFRSASAMNIKLKPSVGSVQQTTSKLQAAAAANQNQVTRGKATVNGISAARQPPRVVVKPGKYRTTISLSDTSGGVRSEGHVSRRYPKSVTPNGSHDNRFYTDMKGLPPLMDDTYDSFDPPPPPKPAQNGHSEPPEAETSRQVTNPGENQLIHPVLTNGVESHSDTEPTHRFHVRELLPQTSESGELPPEGSDEHPFFSVARDVKQPETYKNELQIISAKGTVRGFKNRVRAGIAVFRQQNDGVKNYRILEKDQVILYTTSMMIVRSTHEKCIRVKKILQTHMVQYVEKDIFMSRENQRDLMVRVGKEHLEVPQVFADGQHLGGAEELTALNESGELRKIFKHFRKVSSSSSCEKCGGYSYIPCTSCHGSKKSLHRNHFTAEFCALRCIVCDENGLVKCDVCFTNDVS